MSQSLMYSYPLHRFGNYCGFWPLAYFSLSDIEIVIARESQLMHFLQNANSVANRRTRIRGILDTRGEAFSVQRVNRGIE